MIFIDVCLSRCIWNESIKKTLSFNTIISAFIKYLHNKIHYLLDNIVNYYIEFVVIFQKLVKHVYLQKYDT